MTTARVTAGEREGAVSGCWAETLMAARKKRIKK
jgi:hypothetical protein